MSKFIFVTGGVVSGLGKGITAASLGRLLKQRGLKVAAQKLDPYMNIDPGTMSPFQHGEVFVTDDGAETDLDLGHYERFIDENLTKFSNLTAGKIYSRVLERERAGEYQGRTVQVIPHVTEEIKSFIYAGAESCDVLIVEIGGTTGDIESQPFLEAIRQISLERGAENCLFIHVTLVPFLKAPGEHKSKPTQHSVKELRAMGISPNIIITRADEHISAGINEKIALFCNVKADCVIENVTLVSLYEAPLMLNKNGFDDVVCRELKIDVPPADLSEWQNLVNRINDRRIGLTIGIVGKYIELHDAYLSIIESLNHAGFEIGAQIYIKWIDCENISEKNAPNFLEDVDGVIIPGGFGERGINGKIAACRYVRENNIPFLGICLGLHIAVIEFCRNVLKLTDAHSREFDENNAHRVIDFMAGQEGMALSGGTMRLGAYPCHTGEGTLLRHLYGKKEISERHRHRFEVNNEYRDKLVHGGLVLSGLSPDENLVEAIELPDKCFFIAVQYHPEFLSRPNKPHPLFRGLLRACTKV
ncbi:MAG: CTP synthase [Lachnospiraceae bacterium]|nr:CTP synthase [Lachnospiraceae bacterium]